MANKVYKSLDCNEITFTDGRAYLRHWYSQPLAIRQFMYPATDEEGPFFFFDASNAELYLQAWFYRDTALMADIESQRFWDIWLRETYPEPLVKADVKRAIFCMSYSCGTSNFPPSLPKSFFKDFTARYSTWWSGLLRTKKAFESNDRRLFDNYCNVVTGTPIKLPTATRSKGLFQLLNYRVSQSLSSALLILFAEVYRELSKTGGKVYASSFDSLWATWKGHTLEEYEALVYSVQERLLADGTLPSGLRFRFKFHSGSNAAEAQGWNPADYSFSDSGEAV